MKKMTLIAAGVLWSASTTASAYCHVNNSIRSVTNTHIGMYEYVVFTIKGHLLGSYTVSAATGPTFEEDPSGNMIAVTGPAYTKIQFTGMKWMCTVHQNYFVPKSTIKQVAKVGQFEGVLGFVVGHQAATYLGHYTYSIPGYEKVILKFHH